MHHFAIDPPVEPMLARAVAQIPTDAGGWGYEPKWDGFRALVFRRGDEVVVQGRMRSGGSGAWDLTYAFPELVERVRALRCQDLVLDGEIVIIRDGRLSFDALQSRLRPRKEAGGRKIAQLAQDSPTSYIAFDLLAVDGQDVRDQSAERRRAALENVLADEAPPIHLSPHTRDRETARRWFEEVPGAGLDGIIAKPLDGPYTPGRRTLMKVKHQHTIDVVCAGWRPYSKPGPDGSEIVGSALIGLYDASSVLQMIGAVGAFPMRERAALAERFAPLAMGPDEPHPWTNAVGRAPGAPSRWNSGRDRAWHPIAPVLVAEVQYGQAEGDRLRHPATLLRWRPDKDPVECTTDQFVAPPPLDVDRLLGSPPGR